MLVSIIAATDDAGLAAAARGATTRSAPANTGNGWKDAPAPVVMQSMPYFAMPMVYAQMPVMPVAAASKAAPEPFDKAAPSCQGSSARLDGLDRDVRDLHVKVEALLESVRQQNESIRQMRNMMNKPSLLEPNP